MKGKEHLSIFGIGPAYAVLSALMTGSVCLLDFLAEIPHWSFPISTPVMKICSVLLLIPAACLWLNVLMGQRIAQRIQKNELVTMGAYAWVRNPIYTAIMLIMWALLLWTGNLLFLFLFPIYPLLMMVMLKPTEEKWLTELYGQKYRDYCKQVNRCISWFPKRKK